MRLPRTGVADPGRGPRRRDTEEHCKSPATRSAAADRPAIPVARLHRLPTRCLTQHGNAVSTRGIADASAPKIRCVGRSPMAAIIPAILHAGVELRLLGPDAAPRTPENGSASRWWRSASRTMGRRRLRLREGARGRLPGVSARDENARDHEGGEDRGSDEAIERQPALRDRLVQQVAERRTERPREDEGTPEEQGPRDRGEEIRRRDEQQARAFRIRLDLGPQWRAGSTISTVPAAKG